MTKIALLADLHREYQQWEALLAPTIGAPSLRILPSSPPWLMAAITTGRRASISLRK